MNPTDAETLMLLAGHFLALAIVCAIFVWMLVLHRRARALNPPFEQIQKPPVSPSGSMPRPANWLAIRSTGPETVRATLKDKDDFFISPQVNGWVIVTGPGLPNPSDDVDACFHFLTALSRELGHVQFFYAEKFSRHHAWARMDDGCVTRAYAWTGETAWNQGATTVAETETGMKCFNYGENSDAEFQATNENAAANVEKIPLLAARWSVDPAVLHHAGGISGESPRFY